MRYAKEKHVFHGKLTGTFEQLHAAGCIQAGGDYKSVDEARSKLGRLFSLLIIETSNNPCDGCPAFNDGACKAYKQYHADEIAKQQKAKAEHMAAITPTGTSKYPGMSIKQIAAQLGISKNEVQRRRDRGEL